ncbi:MAG TPA: MarR family winged helix-turn-helix transcriptional regulator [Dongiaceae bacterium]|jgi:DNA-binding MarR family transcriptional regulator|nr:MarR family winged helix-turn-helix transcriptional regulator [Dongiaceae bacterium]
MPKDGVFRPSTHVEEVSFGFLLHDTARLLRRDFERRAKVLGLTRAQWSVLFHLSKAEGSSQAELADILEVQPITLARQIDKLEHAGWVERRSDPTDRRCYRLYLRPASHPILAKMRAFGQDTRAVALAGIDLVKRDELMKILKKIRENLTALEPKGPKKNG